MVVGTPMNVYNGIAYIIINEKQDNRFYRTRSRTVFGVI